METRIITVTLRGAAAARLREAYKREKARRIAPVIARQISNASSVDPYVRMIDWHSLSRTLEDENAQI